MQAAEDLFQAALALPEAERERLVAKLIESLDGPGEPVGEEEWGAAWAEELQRRVKTIEDGTAELIPADKVMAEIRARLASRRG